MAPEAAVRREVEGVAAEASAERYPSLTRCLPVYRNLEEKNAVSPLYGTAWKSISN
jgi:hypothetical protein